MAKSEKYILVDLEDEKSKRIAESISNKTARKILDYLSTKEDAGAEEISKELKLPISTIDYNLKNLKKAGLVEAKQFIWSQRGKRIVLYRLARKFIVIAPKFTDVKRELKRIIPFVGIAALVSLIIQYVANLRALHTLNNLSPEVTQLANTYDDTSKNLEAPKAVQEAGTLTPDTQPELTGIDSAQPDSISGIRSPETHLDGIGTSSSLPTQDSTTESATQVEIPTGQESTIPDVTSTTDSFIPEPSQDANLDAFQALSVPDVTPYGLYFFLGAIFIIVVYFLIKLIRSKN